MLEHWYNVNITISSDRRVLVNKMTRNFLGLYPPPEEIG